MATTKKYSFSNNQIIALGFFSFILFGAFTLMLPVTSTTGNGLSFVDALFMSTSAVCVTGLSVVDAGTHFSLFGQLFFIFLIQCGGLGIMTLAAVIIVLFGKKINYPERILMRDALNQVNITGIIRLTMNLFKVSLLIEFVAGSILAVRFFQDYGLKGIYYGYWHAISAYCNAGFDLFGNYQSLSRYANDATVNITITALIILGGLGFHVLFDIFSRKKFKDYSIHNKLVVITTIFLIVFGTVVIFLLEYTNPKTLANLSFYDQFWISYFQSVAPRTAGFSSVDLGALRPETIFFTCLLMFIGASPASTGGGIKTTTFAIIVMSTWSLLRGNPETVFQKRRFTRVDVYRAFVIAVIGLMVVFCGIFALTVLEDKQFVAIMFEVVSAFGTVGSSVGITGQLCDASKLILSLIMFIGRVGPLTLAMALTLGKSKGKLKHPEENISVG